MKHSIVFTVILLLSLPLTSCGSRRYSPAYDGYSESSGKLATFGSEKEIVGNADRKIIYSTDIQLTVKQPDTAAVQISAIAKKYNGYVQTSGTSLCVIRVEEKNLKSAENDIALLGKVESKTSSGQDVTGEYMDFQIRLENAEKARERYLELLAKAENVQAALLVEKELERLNETIELMKGQMNRIDHLSTYATITVYLKEKKKPGIIGYIGVGIYKAVKWLFVRN